MGTKKQHQQQRENIETSSSEGWMNEEDRFSDFYRKGVSDFIDFAYSNRIINSLLCPCPCPCPCPCLKYHLEVHSIYKSYVFWSVHGDKSTSEVVQEHLEENIEKNVDVKNINDETVEEHTKENITDEQCGLGDFVDKTYGVFEGLDKDVDETNSLDLGKKYHRYKELTKEKIYPGYEGDETTLSVIGELQHIKNMFGWSGNSVTYLLGRLKKWFPEGNTFPETYPTMKAMLIDLGMKYQPIHVLIIMSCSEKNMRMQLCVPSVKNQGLQ
ncbi:hypothetical protein C5167_007794 [Papaver somniferum]|nr:hypothetical protein C5167_007794 [Papaver somniferum]